ncbi:MAG: aminotransferase class I/II-fold pyridoxal phosphate-dependent enzyme [Candidatus Kapaibacteriota bacterium]|jgi:alanine-synthesizing transaminase
MALAPIIPAKRTEKITYAIRDIIAVANEVAKTGKKLYYLNIGDPNVYDFVTPEHIIEANIKAMRDGKNGYSPSSGIPEAIEAVRIDAEKKGIKNIQDIFITSGAAEAIETCLNALLNAGDNFLMPTPGYPLYIAIQNKLGLEPNPYYLNEENGWLPDIEDIKSKINSKTKAIVLINPNNPTGSLYTREVLEQIIELAKEYNLVIFADEIYDKLIFDGKEMISIASLDSEVTCITFSGMSKNYLAPGWRLGWGIVSGKKEFTEDFVEAINKILRARVSANHPEQYAIPVALLGDQSHIQDTISRLEKRRDVVYNKIQGIDGISLVKPEGAFYAFPKIEVKDDWNFCIALLRATGVMVVPGMGFGQKEGTKHFRIVILPNEEILGTAFDLLKDFYYDYRTKE